MSDKPPHDAGRQAQETARIYREARVSRRLQAERQAAQLRAERQAQQHP